MRRARCARALFDTPHTVARAAARKAMGILSSRGRSDGVERLQF